MANKIHKQLHNDIINNYISTLGVYWSMKMHIMEGDKY